MSQRSLFCLGWVMAALTVAGCSNSRTTGDLSIGGLQVASIQPNNGGGEVGPATPITVTFAEAVADPTSDNLVVDDGAGPLSGVLEAQPDGLTWRWTALNGLPRGGSITVRVVAGIRGRSGNRLAADVTETFRVRDAAVLATYEVPNGNAAVMVWPNGRRAVSVGASTYEVVIGGLLNRPNTFGGGAIPYGDGDYLELTATASLGFVFARRNLDGSERLILRPAAQPNISAVHADGHAVLVGYTFAPVPTAWQLWRMMRDDTIAQELEPLAASLPSRPSAVIASDGTIWASYRDAATGRATLAKFAPGNTFAETFAVAGTDSVGEVSCGIAADGTVTMVWVAGPRTLRVARYSAATGLVPASEELVLPVVPDSVSIALQVADSGSAIVRVGLEFGAPLFVEQYSALRLEASGWVGGLMGYGNSSSGLTPSIPKFEDRRGEWWAVQPSAQGGSLQRRRSRPGQGIAEWLPFYVSPLSGQSIVGFDYGFDLVGRGLLVMSEFFPSPIARIVVLE